MNADPRAVGDDDVTALRCAGLTDKGVVQLVHLVSDFASYNQLNRAGGFQVNHRSTVPASTACQR